MNKKRLSQKEYRTLKENFRLTKLQREVLVGILLGDGTLETLDGGKKYRLVWSQSYEKKEYVDHLYELFKDVITTPPYRRERVIGEKKYWSYGFKTLTLSQFRFYAHIFYKEKRKVVPRLIHRFCTNISLAYWYMDDGSIKSKASKGTILNTQGFTKADCTRLKELLGSKWNLQVRLRQQKKENQYQLYISGKSFEIMDKLLSPYLIECMKYKFPPKRKEKRVTKLPKE